MSAFFMILINKFKRDKYGLNFISWDLVLGSDPNRFLLSIESALGFFLPVGFGSAFLA